MKYFVPQVKLSADLPVQHNIEEKFGGYPWGLRQADWPMCKECGAHQTLLAQLAHHPEHLNLGASGRMLFVFQCTDGCSSWEGGSGCNACFVMDVEELTDSVTPLPQDAPLPEVEVRILGWLEFEDAVQPEQLPAFFDEDQHMELAEDVLDAIPSITKLGGAPVWCQSPNEAPKDYQFVAQLEESHSIFEKPQDTEWQGYSEPHMPWKQRWTVGEHNFGSGSAYIFLRYKPGEKPDGWFFWQC